MGLEAADAMRSVNMAPPPGLFSTVALPPCAFMISFTIGCPRPQGLTGSAHARNGRISARLGCDPGSVISNAYASIGMRVDCHFGSWAATDERVLNQIPMLKLN